VRGLGGKDNCIETAAETEVEVGVGGEAEPPFCMAYLCFSSLFSSYTAKAQAQALTLPSVFFDTFVRISALFCCK